MIMDQVNKLRFGTSATFIELKATLVDYVYINSQADWGKGPANNAAPSITGKFVVAKISVQRLVVSPNWDNKK